MFQLTHFVTSNTVHKRLYKLSIFNAERRVFSMIIYDTNEDSSKEGKRLYKEVGCI